MKSSIPVPEIRLSFCAKIVLSKMFSIGRMFNVYGADPVLIDSQTPARMRFAPSLITTMSSLSMPGRSVTTAVLLSLKSMSRLKLYFTHSAPPLILPVRWSI